MSRSIDHISSRIHIFFFSLTEETTQELNQESSPALQAGNLPTELSGRKALSEEQLIKILLLDSGVK